MKIWLINPPQSAQTVTGVRAVVSNLFFNSPPLGLGYLAAALEDAGHRVTITDCPVERVYAQHILAMAQQISPDLVGVTSTTTHFPNALDIAKRLKAALPNLPICIGGPHFNANPELLVVYRAFDFGVFGEGERTIVEAVQALESGQAVNDVPGVVTADGDRVAFAPARPPIDDLDSILLPARHLFPMKRYRPLPNDHYRLPKASMITSRGCPFSCKFCDKSTFGNRYRTASPQHLLHEMRVLRDDFGIRDVAIVDSLISPTPKRINAILDAMEAAPPGVSWTCSGRANIMDEHVLGRMKNAGCWRVRFAIESGNPDILKSIDKDLTKPEFDRSVRMADKAGLRVKAFFMVGHVGDTVQTIEQTIAFAKSLPLADITVQFNTPLKGTRQYDECLKKGTILDKPLSKHNFFEPVFVPEGLTPQKLMELFSRFYREFYLRPSLIWRHIKTLRSISDISRYLMALPLVFTLFFGRRKRGSAPSEP
jgi:radical SAM superfamily enzyme YgiQ (UPF0313 family)